MRTDHIKHRIRKNSPDSKLREFESLRRRIERELFYWVGLRFGLASITEKNSEEQEQLSRCETGGDFLRFYLQTAQLTKNWSSLSFRERWHIFRRGFATPFYRDGSWKEDYDRERFLEQLRNLVEIDPGVTVGCLP